MYSFTPRLSTRCKICFTVSNPFGSCCQKSNRLFPSCYRPRSDSYVFSLSVHRGGGGHGPVASAVVRSSGGGGGGWSSGKSNGKLGCEVKWGGGSPSPSSRRAGDGVGGRRRTTEADHGGEGHGRYASCGQAGGRSCFI